MWRVALPFSVLGLVVLAAHPSPAGAQSRPKTDKDKIANAMTAAPPEIARNATITDWPAREGGEFRVLRQGTNGWVCLPTFPQAPGNEPMCLDREWEKLIAAYLTKGTPQPRQVGLAYMLSTESEGSNTDPFARGPTPDNQWHKTGPHAMLVFPDPKMYEGIPTEPHNGGPYLMWKGTPYQHVMMPVSRDAHGGDM
jgi:hypothetical protein